MGTLIMTAGGFANLSASAPPNWPATVTWPGGQSSNGSNTLTISDADWVRILTWLANSQQSLQGTVTTPSTPTAAQVRASWLQVWVTGTINAVVQLFTPAVVPATPPTIGLT